MTISRCLQSANVNLLIWSHSIVEAKHGGGALTQVFPLYVLSLRFLSLFRQLVCFICLSQELYTFIIQAPLFPPGECLYVIQFYSRNPGEVRVFSLPHLKSPIWTGKAQRASCLSEKEFSTMVSDELPDRLQRKLNQVGHTGPLRLLVKGKCSISLLQLYLLIKNKGSNHSIL